MAIFKQKKHKSSIEEAVERAEHIFDESFRNELRNHGRMYFEKVINESAGLFKQDLDATIIQVYTELKQHITTQLDERFDSYGKTMKEAQDAALDIIKHNAKTLEAQQDLLSKAIQKSIADQDEALKAASKETEARVTVIKQAQDLALRSLNSNVQALQEQQQQLSTMLQKTVMTQEEMILSVFEQNMAQVVEHYLLGALGDQYDLKTQLPSIIKQMEANKEAMMDDMKL